MRQILLDNEIKFATIDEYIKNATSIINKEVTELLKIYPKGKTSFYEKEMDYFEASNMFIKYVQNMLAEAIPMFRILSCSSALNAIDDFNDIIIDNETNQS